MSFVPVFPWIKTEAEMLVRERKTESETVFSSGMAGIKGSELEYWSGSVCKEKNAFLYLC